MTKDKTIAGIKILSNHSTLGELLSVEDMETVNTEVQKQKEEAVKGFVKWLDLDEGGKGMYLRHDMETYLKEEK